MSPPNGPTPRGKLAVSELFTSVQGEGASAGEPALFLRLAHCNLRCAWCDTRYSWDFSAYRFEDEVRLEPTAALAERLVELRPERLVVTGGEPLIQRDELAELLVRLPPELVVEVETNGTLDPGAALLARVTQWNVSPKLAHSGDPESKRLRLDVLETLRDTGRAYLKLVVASEGDLGEAEALIARSGFARDRVLFMPKAASRAELRARAGFVEAAALARGVRYSPRLHIERWGGERGR